MATQDDVKVESGESINEEVEGVKSDETEKSEDQNNETDAGSETEKESEETESKEGDEPETKEETKAEFKKRFTQMKGETPEEYLKNLEDAYANSSTEGQRLAKRAKDAETKFQQVATLVATDPEFAKRLNDSGTAPIIDPAIEFARKQMEDSYKKDYTAFAGLHPRIISEPGLYERVVNELDVIAAANEARGITLSMAEGLRKAWISLGEDESDKKEDIMDKVKEQASTPNASAKPKSTDKTPEFTPEQIAVAEKMGISAKDLAQYSK